jgi:1,4-dihydroxy-2-naphthoate octaprenyltransferase
MSLLPAAAALAGAVLIQVVTNLANDYFDYFKGSDHEGRLGPTRVVQAGLLTPRQVMNGTLLVMAFVGLIGLYLVQVGGTPILIMGTLSLMSAVAYTGGPFPLAYHGLGDPFVFLFFGLVATGGTYWVQALALPPDLLLAGTGVGALTTAILVVNNLRDIETDEAAGKRTLAVRLGRRGTRLEYALLIAVAGLAPVAGVAVAGWSPWTLVGIAGLWPVVRATIVVFGPADAAALNGALVATARGVSWYAGLMSMGFVLGS